MQPSTPTHLWRESSKYVHANSISMKGHLSYDGKVECSFSPFTLQEDQEHRAPCPLQKHRAEGSTWNNFSLPPTALRLEQEESSHMKIKQPSLLSISLLLYILLVLLFYWVPGYSAVTTQMMLPKRLHVLKIKILHHVTQMSQWMDRQCGGFSISCITYSFYTAFLYSKLPCFGH